METWDFKGSNQTDVCSSLCAGTRVGALLLLLLRPVSDTRRGGLVLLLQVRVRFACHVQRVSSRTGFRKQGEEERAKAWADRDLETLASLLLLLLLNPQE